MSDEVVARAEESEEASAEEGSVAVVDEVPAAEAEAEAEEPAAEAEAEEPAAETEAEAVAAE
jgi:hypothetical protein